MNKLINYIKVLCTLLCLISTSASLSQTNPINNCTVNITQSDTSLCSGTSLNLQANVTSNSGNCFVQPMISSGNLNFWASSTAVDNVGNIYHSGGYSGTISIGSFTLPGIGGRDIFLAKYNSCGELQWAIRAGSSANEDNAGADYGKGLATDALGNVYMAGRYNQTCTVYGLNGTSFVAPYTTVSNTGHQDGFLVKISPAGQILWGATLRGSSNDGINGVTVDPSGNPIVSAGFNGCCPSSFAGTVYGTTNTLGISSFGSNYGTGAVIKFNSSGTVQWAARIYNRDASAGGITTDAAGNIYATSSFRSWSSGTAAQVYDGLNAVNTLFNPGIGLGYLIKLAPNGAWQWGVTFGNAGDGVNTLTVGTDISLDGSGNVWLSGQYSGANATFYSTSGSNLSGPSSTESRGFVAKYSPSGQALAVNTFQKTSGNNTQFLGIAVNGNIVRAVGSYTGANQGLNDALYANYDLNANLQSTNVFGGSGDDFIYCIRNFGSGFIKSGAASAGANISGTSINSNQSFLWNTNASGGTGGSTSYLWSNGATTSSINISPTQTTTYYVTATQGSTSCTDSVTIAVNNIATNIFAQDTISACGQSYQLDAGQGFSSYSWNTGAATSTINVSQSGWYRCTVTVGACSSTDSIFLALLNYQIVQGDTTLCEPATITINVGGQQASNTNSSYQWQLLIPGNTFIGTQVNFDPSGFNPNTGKLYSVLKNSTVNRVYEFNLNNNTVNSLNSINPPGELYEYALDVANNRIVANRVGRDAVYSLPLTGGTWAQIGSGGFDAESYSCATFWNPISNRYGYFGGYGFYATKNWIWENNGSGWINTYTNNNNCNPAKRVGSQIAKNSNGTKLFIFSGQGSCDGNQFASSCALGSPWPTDVGVYCWLRDIWELDLSNNQFQNIMPVNSQSILREGSFSYDFDNNTFYIIGGNAPNPTYGSYTPFVMDVLRYRRNIDSGFLPITTSGTPPPSTNNGVSIYDGTNNRIIYARNDGIWALNLTAPTTSVTYLWSTGATTPSITVTPTQTTTYYVTVSNGTNSCQDSVTLTVNNLPNTLFAQDTVSACGQSYQLDVGNGFSSYNWNTGATTSTINANQSGWYVCTVSQGFCSSTDSVYLSVLNAYIVNNDTSVCIGQSLDLTSNSLGGALGANYSLDFPNVGQYNGNAKAVCNTNLSGFDITDNFTIEFWIKAEGAYYWHLMGKNTFGNNSQGWLLKKPGNGLCLGWTYVPNEFEFHSFAFNQWEHVAICFDDQSNTFRYFKNGQLVAMQTRDININPSPYAFTIGHELGTGNWFDGKIDNLRISNVSRYQSNFNPSQNFINDQFTLAMYDFNEGSGNTSFDVSGNGRNLTLTNTNYSTDFPTGSIINPTNILWSTGATTPSITVTPTQTTTYYLTVSNGITSCTDSVTVTVNPIGSDTTFVTLCQGETYTFNGTDYSQSGTYTDTLSNAGGCLYLSTLSLTVNPTYSSSFEVFICEGDSYTLPVGQSVSEPGIYENYLTTIEGCDSLVVVTVRQNPNYSLQQQAVICQGASYTLPDGQSVNSTGTYVSNLTTSAGCDSIITTSLIVNPVYNSQQNIAICQGTSYTLPNGQSVSSTGTYVSNLTTSAGCDSIITTNLTVNPVYNLQQNIAICQGASYTLPDGQSVNSAGTYVSSLTTSVGCDSIITTSLIVNPVYNSQQNIAICQGASYTLPNGQSVSSTGAYVSNLTTTAGCDSIITTNLIVNPVYSLQQNIAICQGASYTLPDGQSVNSAGTYVSGLTTSEGCDSIITTILTINPVYNIQQHAAICTGSSYQLPGGAFVSITGTYVNMFKTAEGCDSIITTSLVVNPVDTSITNVVSCTSYSWNGQNINTSGVYTWNGTSSLGCDSVALLYLTIPDPLQLSITSTDVTTYGAANGTATVAVLNSNGPFIYSWSTLPIQTTSTAAGLTPGTYTVSVSDTNGCTVSTSITITQPAPICLPFRTYGPGGWGSTANGFNPGSYLATHFAAAYPNGLQIGSCGRFLRLTNASAVVNFLPTAGTPARLPAGTLINPTANSYKNTLAGHVATLNLNMTFDSLDASFAGSQVLFRNAVVAMGPFAGMTVWELYDLANTALGCNTSKTYLATINNAVDNVNNSWSDGIQRNNYLACPSTPVSRTDLSTIEISVENQLLVFPNPTSGAFTASFEIHEASNVELLLTDLTGKVLRVIHRNVEPGLYEDTQLCDGLELTPGIYLVRFSEGDKPMVTTKVVVTDGR